MEDYVSKDLYVVGGGTMTFFVKKIANGLFQDIFSIISK